MTTTIKIHREELYKQVWAESVTKLAAQYGISGETGGQIFIPDKMGN